MKYTQGANDGKNPKQKPSKGKMIWSMIALLGINILQGHTAMGRGGNEDDTHTGGDLMTRALRGNPTSGMACSVLVNILCGSALQVLPA